MKTLSWKDMDAHLQSQAAKHRLRDADAFAADFKARAALAPQLAPETTLKAPAPLFRWGYAAGLALTLLAVGVFSLLPDRSVAETRIRALEIIAPHSGVIIMDDQTGRGTIVWITGMDSNNNKG